MFRYGVKHCFNTDNYTHILKPYSDSFIPPNKQVTLVYFIITLKKSIIVC